MTSPVSAIEAIEKAMEGVKHSKWFMSPWHVEEDASAVRNQSDGSYICNASSDSFAAYIATVNPAAITALLDRLDAAEAEVKRLREALEPFSAIGDEGRGSALADDAPLAVVNANMPDLPTWLAKVRGVITQGDVRRARAAMEASNADQ